MIRILAIDPGYEQSAWLVLDDGAPYAFGIQDNDAVLARLRSGWPQDADAVVIEKVESFGMVVGREVFDTVHWAGRFTEAAARGDEVGRAMPVHQLPRRAVKLAICQDSRAKDANIRQALIDRFGGPAAVGLKASPGPLYGISKDVWSALAIAVTYAETAA